MKKITGETIVEISLWVATVFSACSENSAMKFEFHQEADAFYLSLADGEIVETKEVHPGIILDFDAQQQLVGIEILSLTRRTSPEPSRSSFPEWPENGSAR